MTTAGAMKGLTVGSGIAMQMDVDVMQKLCIAAGRPMTRAEAHEQRVSWVVDRTGHDRDTAERILRQAGYTRPDPLPDLTKDTPR